MHYAIEEAGFRDPGTHGEIKTEHELAELLNQVLLAYVEEDSNQSPTHFLIEKTQQRLLDWWLVQREVFIIANSLQYIAKSSIQGWLLSDLFSERFNIFFYIQVWQMITQTLFGDNAQ